VRSPAGATRSDVLPVSIRRLILALSLAVAGAAMAQERALPSMPTVPLQVGDRVIRAEIVSTVQDRARGLMHRVKLAPDAGMLFVFGAEPGQACLWMRNTRIPLSAAFLDAGGRVINIVDMRPHDETLHCARGQAQFVLEVNQGTFAAAGVTAGARVGGLPAAR
jgi:uncharacterized protein